MFYFICLSGSIRFVSAINNCFPASVVLPLWYVFCYIICLCACYSLELLLSLAIVITDETLFYLFIIYSLYDAKLYEKVLQIVYLNVPMSPLGNCNLIVFSNRFAVPKCSSNHSLLFSVVADNFSKYNIVRIMSPSIHIYKYSYNDFLKTKISSILVG